jgi:hypothetical protein
MKDIELKMSLTKWVFLFSVSALFLSAGPCWADSTPHYDIQAAIDVEQKVLSASQTVRYTNTTQKDLNEIYFHIYPNREYSLKEKDILQRYAGFFKVNPFPEGFQTAQFKLLSVKDDAGTDLNSEIQGDDKTLLRVALPNTLHPGETITLALNFHLTIPHAYGRLGWNEKVIALSHWYPILSVNDEKEGWRNYPFYPFHRPFFSESATYSVSLTVPANQTVIHSGEETEVKNISESQKQIVIETSHPIREFTLSMSEDYQVVEENWNGVAIKSFYLPGHEDKAKQALEYARGMMEYYSDKFTPYPYKAFSLAPVYLGYGGEQMSNMAFFDTRVYELPTFLNRYFDFLISHETGHQWLYNMVGIDA